MFSDTEFTFQSSIWKSIVSVELSTKTVKLYFTCSVTKPSDCIQWGRGYSDVGTPSISLVTTTAGCLVPSGKKSTFSKHIHYKNSVKCTLNTSWASDKNIFLNSPCHSFLPAVRAGWWYCRTLRAMEIQQGEHWSQDKLALPAELGLGQVGGWREAQWPRPLFCMVPFRHKHHSLSSGPERRCLGDAAVKGTWYFISLSFKRPFLSLCWRMIMSSQTMTKTRAVIQPMATAIHLVKLLICLTMRDTRSSSSLLAVVA